MTLRKVPDSDARRHAGGDYVGVTLAATNTGDRPCALSGYLDVAVSGYRSDTPVESAKPVEHDGRFAPDPGPRQFVVDSGKAAYTELSYYNGGSASGHRGFRLTFSLPGGHGVLAPPIDLGANLSPSFTVTALTDRPLLLPTEPFNPEGYSKAKVD
jgi:hypothetical protein